MSEPKFVPTDGEKYFSRTHSRPLVEKIEAKVGDKVIGDIHEVTYRIEKVLPEAAECERSGTVIFAEQLAELAVNPDLEFDIEISAKNDYGVLMIMKLLNVRCLGDIFPDRKCKFIFRMIACWHTRRTSEGH